jgi:hypothetical protein
MFRQTSYNLQSSWSVGCGSQIAALTLIPYLFSLIFVIYRILSLEAQEVGYH